MILLLTFGHFQNAVELLKVILLLEKCEPYD